ncbi:hypothetical protein PMIN05_009801 [Paraphaeosphaeria minitans]
MPPKRQASVAKLHEKQSRVEPTIDPDINMSDTSGTGEERVTKKQKLFAPEDTSFSNIEEHTGNQSEDIATTNEAAAGGEVVDGAAAAAAIDDNSALVHLAGLATVPAPPQAPLVVVNRPLVDRALFPNAPDPARNQQGAQAYANLVHGKTLPTRGPLACKSTITIQAISKMIRKYGSAWFEEEGFVQPWKVYLREERADLKTKGILEAHLPASYPVGTGYPPAGYRPHGRPVPLSHAGTVNRKSRKAPVGAYFHALVHTYDTPGEDLNDTYRENVSEHWDAMIDSAMIDLFASDGKTTGTVYQYLRSDDQNLRAFLTPLDAFPSRVVLYKVLNSASGPMLKREALVSVPLEKKPEWLWELYLEAQKMDSCYGRDLVVDGLYSRYRDELTNRRELKRHVVKVPPFNFEKAVNQQLNRNSAQDKPMRDFLLDVMTMNGQLNLNDPATKPIAEAHSPPYSCLDGASKANFCARYHTHGEAPCRTILAPRATPEYNAWHFYENLAPSKPELWDGCQSVEDAKEIFRGKMQDAFTEIQEDRMCRSAVRLARLPGLLKAEIEPIGQIFAYGLLGNNLRGKLCIPRHDMEQWIGVLAGYTEELSNNRSWNASLDGPLSKVQGVLKLFRAVHEKGEVAQLLQTLPCPCLVVDLHLLNS